MPGLLGQPMYLILKHNKKDKFLPFESTSLCKTNIKALHYGIAANARTNINAFSAKFLANSPKIRKLSRFIKTNVYTTIEHYNIG
jgi:hypothetical protein